MPRDTTRPTTCSSLAVLNKEFNLDFKWDKYYLESFDIV